MWPETFAGRASLADAHFGRRYGMVAHPVNRHRDFHSGNSYRSSSQMTTSISDGTWLIFGISIYALDGFRPMPHGMIRIQGLELAK